MPHADFVEFMTITAHLERIRATYDRRIDLHLDRLLRLLDALGAPHRSTPPVIHIAGTNGKGSTQAMLKALLEEQGKRVHAFTSPPITGWADCITLAGSVIDEADLAALADEVEAVNAGRPLTEYEFLTACAFLAFSRVPADVLLLEVCMGGRGDCTNIIENPAACVITPIGHDHQAFLGSTLAEIAYHKAGIFKAGACLVVSSGQAADALAVLRAEAALFDATALVGGQDYEWQIRVDGRWGFRFDSLALELPQPALAGRHQYLNAATALATLAALERRGDTGLGLPDEAGIGRALTAVRWPGRLQRFSRVPGLPADWELWLDGAHNPEALEALTAHADAEWADRPLHIIAGLSRDRDPSLLAALARQASSLTFVDFPAPVPIRSAADLAALSAARSAPSFEAALEALGADEFAGGPARILVSGSLYLVGEALRRLAARMPQPAEMARGLVA